MEKKRNLCDYCTRIVIMVCILFMVYIVTCFVTQNIREEISRMINLFEDFVAKMNVEEENIAITGTERGIDWQVEYPFSESQNIVFEDGTISIIEKYLGTIETVETKISSYVNDGLPAKNTMLRVSESLKAMIGFDIQLSEDKRDILYMKNGHLAFVQPEVSIEDIEEIADSLSDFNHYLTEKGIPFLYVNAGSKVCPSDRQLDIEDVEYTNENGDALQIALAERNVRYIDFREEMLSADLDWYSSYYKTDHHWTTQTGLWASKTIAEILNTEYGYSFDENLFELSAWKQISFENFWIGVLGRTDGFLNSDVEGFTLFLPRFETDLSIQIPTKEIDLRGEYMDTMVEMSVLNGIKSYSKEDMLSKRDAYHASRLRNDDLVSITNYLPTNNDGKKILFIQDSFGWYSTTFLATDISKIDVIYPMKFNGSIRAYIEKSDPDMVIMMYCERQIGKMDWSTHLDGYDLR